MIKILLLLLLPSLAWSAPLVPNLGFAASSVLVTPAASSVLAVLPRKSPKVRPLLSFAASAVPLLPLDFTIQLESVKFVDLVRMVFGDILHLSYVVDKELEDNQDSVSVNWLNFKKEQLRDSMNDLADSRGFDYIDKHGSIFIKKKSADKLLETLVYKPKFRTARYLSDFVAHLTTAKPVTQRAVVNPLAQGAQGIQAGQDTSSPTSVNALQDKIDSDMIVMNVSLVDMHKALALLEQLDTPISEVMIKAAVIEVQTNKDTGSAFQMVSSKVLGANIVPPLPSGANSISLGAGGFSVLLASLDSDSRFKTISRPSVRVKSGGTAKFLVGQDVPVLASSTLDKNGNPVQSVNYVSSGDILTVTPDIHQSIIDLSVTQELSSFTSTTSGVNNSPTLLKRTVSSSLSVRPNELITIAGLSDLSVSSAHSRLFGFEIGRSDSSASTEIIVLLTAETVFVSPVVP